MSRPVLGVICCTRTVGIEPAQAVMHRYITSALQFADAAALLVPSLPGLMNAAEVAPRLDGLLLTGSPSNMEAHHYGQGGANDAAGPYDPDRDQMTRDLVESMLALGRPVFGICRGLQELNVIFGGTLRRDCSSHPDLMAHHAPDDVGFNEMFEHRHPVNLTPGGMLSTALGRDELTVNSVHYQGIDRVGVGLMVEARAPDGMVEAISGSVNGAPVLGVQWHPEWDAADNPDAQAYFRLLGRALRGTAR